MFGQEMRKINKPAKSNVDPKSSKQGSSPGEPRKNHQMSGTSRWRQISRKFYFTCPAFLTETRSLNLQQWQEKLPLTGRNLQQDQAHHEEPVSEGPISGLAEQETAFCWILTTTDRLNPPEDKDANVSSVMKNFSKSHQTLRFSVCERGETVFRA